VPKKPVKRRQNAVRSTRTQSASGGGPLFRRGVDARTWQGKRWREVYGEHVALLGGESALSEGQRTAIRDLASTVVELERFQERQVTGEEISTGTYLTASNNRRRLLRELGLADSEDGEERAGSKKLSLHPSEIPPPPGPFQFDLSLLTELELDWLEVAFETALERTRTGYDPFGAHGEMAIFQALRRIATGHGRAVDFWQAGNIKHYAWLVKKAALKVPFPLFFGGYHVEPEPVEIDHPSYPPDPIEPEEGETVGFVEDPLPGIPPPADRLPAPQKALPAPEGSIEGEYLPPREPRPIVHPSVMSAARRGTIGDGYDD